MTTQSRISDPIATVLAHEASLGSIQWMDYSPKGAVTVQGQTTLSLPEGSCTPSVAADIADLLGLGEHARTLPLFRTGGRVQIRRKGKGYTYTIDGTL